MGDHASKRALLIGINDYPFVSPKLHGCLNDVALMRSMLIHTFNFPSSQIDTLLNEKAVRAAILKSFHKLITDTKTNDTVVIYYSGHGSQIPDKTEVDSLDETIIPYDYRNSVYGAFPILDKQIRNMLDELSAKTTNITIIFDCCHSGGITKDLLTGTEREAPADTREAPSSDDFLPVNRGYHAKKALNDQNARFVLIAGCQSAQKAYETRSANGIVNGMLTLSLVNELSKASAPQTWPAVVEDLGVTIHQSFDQTPELVGLNRNSYVFGATYIPDESYFTAQPGKGIVNIDGGRAQDVTVGSTYMVYPPGTLHFKSGDLGVIEVTKVNDFTAEAKILKGNVPAANCRVVELKHILSKGQETFVSFLGEWKGPALQSKQKMLAINTIKESNQYPNLLYYNRNGEVTIYSGRDTLNPLEIYSIKSEQDVDDLVSSLVRWSKWFRVANLRNDGSRLSITIDFNQSKDIDLSKSDFTYKSGTQVFFSVKNNSASDVFIYILDLNDNADIDVYTLSAFSSDPGQTNSELLHMGQSYSCKFTPRVRPGSNLTRDVFKVIATTVASDFKELRQDHSKSLTEDQTDKSLDPPTGKLQRANDWVTLERVFLTTK